MHKITVHCITEAHLVTAYLPQIQLPFSFPDLNAGNARANSSKGGTLPTFAELWGKDEMCHMQSQVIVNVGFKPSAESRKTAILIQTSTFLKYKPILLVILGNGNLLNHIPLP